MPDLLIEIGCEEIPARMIDGAREEFTRRISELLQRERLTSAGSVRAYSTPRRLAVLAQGIQERQSDVEEQLVGPATKVAFKDGKPTAAAEAFARKAGIDVSQLQTISNAKGEYIAAKVVRKGRSAAEVISDSLPSELNALYWAKNMYWRANKPERFVRPVRWIVTMLDAEVIPVEYAGVKSARYSRGHRILSPTEVVVTKSADYCSDLEIAKVVADPALRKQRILAALDQAASTVAGLRWRRDDALLETVANLTEFPAVILGGFDRKFLSLPEEVLVTVMRDHQKYFAVEDSSGKIAAHFAAVLNTEGDHDGLIRHGNERVLRARFNDAQFFWSVDQKTPLQERREMLRNVTFQKDLGSYYSKTERVRALVGILALSAGSAGVAVSKERVDEAAQLAKTDLTTELVKEFTELQGIVGGLYARAQGHSQAVADAIYDQYRPESSDDSVPRSVEGALLSLSDKADSIAGMFALGLQPSGSKDPFALRRQGNGIVRILAEHRLPLRVDDVFAAALQQYERAPELAGKLKNLREAPAALAAFMRERLEFYLRDVRGFAYDVVNAVLAAGSDDVVDAVARAEAVTALRGTADFLAVSSAFKRIKNILRQANEAGRSWPEEFGENAFTDSAERELGAAVRKTRAEVESLQKEKSYQEALASIARLRPTVDTFFDKVMVMVDDEKLRSNRLALLASMQRSFSEIADFSEIVTTG